MDVIEAIRERRSVRAYRDEEIPEDVMTQVLDAGRLAPSANNRQPWTFVVVKSPEKRKELGQATQQPFVAQAPVIIAAVAHEFERIMSCEVPAYAVDLAIAVDHMTLAAVKFGLGTCWIGAFHQEIARNALGIPGHCKIVALLPIGYPADSPAPKNRKRLDEVVRFEGFDQ
jgi:nitroreductase